MVWRYVLTERWKRDIQRYRKYILVGGQRHNLQYILYNLLMKIHCKYVWELRSRDEYQWIHVKNCVVFSVKINGTETGEQGYRLALCKPVSPLTLPFSALHSTWNSSCWGHCGLAIWTIYIVKTKFRSGFLILLWEILRRSQMFRSMLVPSVTLVLLVFHYFIVKGQKYVYFLNRKASPRF